MNFHRLATDNVYNGPGFRVVLWVSGCSHHCPGCCNPETWDPQSGKEYTLVHTLEIVKELKKPYIQGLTISGGDPFHIRNRSQILCILRFIRNFLETSNLRKDIWVYTGYKYEDLVKDSTSSNLLEYIDVLVDGRFNQCEKGGSHRFRGSANQRLVACSRSYKAGLTSNPYLWED